MSRTGSTPRRRVVQRARRPSLLCMLLCSVMAGGCGAGSPLLHPAHPLAPGDLAASSGVSAHFPPGDVSRAIDTASVATSNVDAEQELAVGGIAQTLSTPGLAPWFSVRAGLGNNLEMGLSYTGRRARGDLRHAWVMDQLALSAGAGLTGLMPNIGSQPPGSDCRSADPGLCPVTVDDRYSEIPGFDAGSVSGFGLDLPLLVGWRSQPGLFALWGGVRARFEDVNADFRYMTGSTAHRARASGTRLVFQGVLGFAVGIKPVWALFEFSPAFERLSGDVELESETVGAEMEGFSFSPAISLTYAP